MNDVREANCWLGQGEQKPKGSRRLTGIRTGYTSNDTYYYCAKTLVLNVYSVLPAIHVSSDTLTFYSVCPFDNQFSLILCYYSDSRFQNK
jgi:hypothetical protein